MVEILEAVENGIGACVLGAGATAAAVYAGFRLAGYRLGVTCRETGPFRLRKRAENQQDEQTDEEKTAMREYRTAYRQWHIASRLNDAEDYYIKARDINATAEQKRRERAAFQARRVAELDAIREERRRKKEQAETEQREPAETEQTEQTGTEKTEKSA